MATVQKMGPILGRDVLERFLGQWETFNGRIVLHMPHHYKDLPIRLDSEGSNVGLSGRGSVRQEEGVVGVDEEGIPTEHD